MPAGPVWFDLVSSAGHRGFLALARVFAGAFHLSLGVRVPGAS